MRQISTLCITDLVSEAQERRSQRVEVFYFADARVLSTLSVGRGHNHLSPGHYVVIDASTRGERLPVSVCVVPGGVEYEPNGSCRYTYVGALLLDNDKRPTFVYRLTGAVEDHIDERSWMQQDQENS